MRDVVRNYGHYGVANICGAQFLLAVGATAEWAMARWPSVISRRVLAVACGVLVLLGVGRSVSRQLVWNSAHLRIVTRSPTH